MKKWMLLIGVAVALVAVVAIAPAVSAQGPAGGFGPGDGTGPVGDGAFGPRHGGGPGFGGGFRMGGPANSLVAVAAGVLDMEPAELVAELQAGQTIADVAEEQGVELQTIVEAFIAPRADRLAELVANGQLTQEEADAILAQVTENVTVRLSEPFTPYGGGFGPGAGFVDEDGDGVCDNLGTGRMGWAGGRHGRWGR